MSRQPLFAIGLVLLLVLAGCSGAVPGGDDAAPDSGVEETRASGGGSDAGDAAGDRPAEDTEFQGSETDTIATQRAVIRTAQISVEVSSYENARGNLTGVARDMGGYVSDSTQEVNRRYNETWTTGRVVYRIPSDRFEEFVDRAKAEGAVLDSQTNAQDVSDQLVDIEARLSNLRAQRDRLRTLYDEADDTEDVLAVGRELSDVQERIERLEAQQRSLEDRVALSTVAVELREPHPEPPEQQITGPAPWYEVGILTAFLNSVDGVVTTLRAVVVGVAYVAPYVLVFGTPLVGIAILLWRR